MPIEFQCPICQHSLRVADEHAGKSARCPSCQQVVPIPTASDTTSASGQDLGASSGNPFSAAPASKLDSSNPYRSPSSTQSAPLSSAKDGAVVPTAANFDEIFGYAWNVYKENVGLLLGMVLITFGISFAFNILVQGVNFTLDQADAGGSVIAIFNFVLFAITYLMNAFLYSGQARLCLKIARQQEASIGDLFSGGDVFVQVLIMGVVVGLLVAVGLLGLIIGAIIVAMLLWTHFYLIVDNKASWFDSLTLAFAIGKLNLGTTFILFVVSIGLSLIGFLALCIGMLFTTGLITLINTVA
ncbi:MAG: hypothetical protein AAGA30_07290 [Planctomycetota bacterium]